MVTNDGNAILRELDLAHPAAKVFVSFASLYWYCCHTYVIHTAIYCTALQTMSCESITSVNLRLSFSLLWNLITLFLLFECIQSMIELSRTQDEEVGDGTTSVIILGMFLHDLIAKFLILLYYIPNGRSDLSWFIGQHILFLQFSIFCIFGAAGEMLHVADAFIDKIHPTVICRGNLIVLLLISVSLLQGIKLFILMNATIL